MAGLDSTITIKSCDYRPCLVEGIRALFHRWVDREKLLLKCDIHVKPEKLTEMCKHYEATGIVPDFMSIDKIKSTLAIVEFEDGTVKEVSHENIRFVDSDNLFYENLPFFKSEQWRKEDAQ